jgi:long-chain acyl-CoA synthetase
VKIADTAFYKRLFYNLFLPVGYKVTDMRTEGRTPNLFWKVLNFIGFLSCFRPLLDKFGLLNMRWAYSGGSFAGEDEIRYFRALGLNVKIWYGNSESGITAGHEDVYYRHPHTCGTPQPGHEIKVADNGELLFRNDMMFVGYYKDPEKTKQVMENGWFRSGDAGFINENGEMVYLDRMADMLTLRDGASFSPSYIEGRLKFCPYIKDVMVCGDENTDYVSAIIQINYGNVGKWAEDHHINYTTFVDLSQKPEVYDLTQKYVEKVNRLLPERGRIKRYIHLHKEFDPDEAELTRTRKLRRSFMEERYKDMIGVLYSDEATFTATADVKYRDGRRGKITTPLQIRTLY